jgi:flagellar hook protein FlgE
VDNTGTLRTQTGEAVQGWTTINAATGNVDTNTAISNIVVPVGGVKQPVATANMTLDLNLNSAAAADATSDHTETIKVHDTLGTSHTLTVNFEKTGANEWSYAVTIPGEDISGGTAGTPFAISGASGTLTFGTNGQLTSPAIGTPIPVAITGLADGASDMAINWNPYNATGAGRITQFGQPSAPEASSQDGSSASQLTRVGLANGGELLAQYSDGTQVVVGQVAMASIRNPESLIAAGNNNYQASALTASPAIGVANTGGRGDIQGGSIESSTVDIAQEFTNLIVLQRGYQANSRVITTADTLSQETINLIH